MFPSTGSGNVVLLLPQMNIRPVLKLNFPNRFIVQLFVPVIIKYFFSRHHVNIEGIIVCVAEGGFPWGDRP